MGFYDVLHEAEAAGIQLPKSVDEWWFKETDFLVVPRKDPGVR